MKKEEELLSPKEALKLANTFKNVSRATLYRWVGKEVSTKQVGTRQFFYKASLIAHLMTLIDETNSETIFDETIRETTDETKLAVDEKIEVDKRILITMRQEAFESGKKEGQMLLMEKNKEYELENQALAKDKNILEKAQEELTGENSELQKMLKSEKFQKMIAIGFIIFWLLAWLGYFMFMYFTGRR